MKKQVYLYYAKQSLNLQPGIILEDVVPDIQNVFADCGMIVSPE